MDAKCFFCGSEQGLERHHVFYGNPNRKKSEKYGAVAMLCSHHHRDHREGVHHNRQMDIQLKCWYQGELEQVLGHHGFIKEFGRSWL